MAGQNGHGVQNYFSCVAVLRLIKLLFVTKCSVCFTQTQHMRLTLTMPPYTCVHVPTSSWLWKRATIQLVSSEASVTDGC